MTPFCLDKLILDLDSYFLTIKKKVIENRLKFVFDFNRELNIDAEIYGIEVFDFVFNLYEYKKVFTVKEFRTWRDFIRDCNFRNEIKVREDIQKVYLNFLKKYKTYFMETLKLEHECQEYVNLKLEREKGLMIERIREL